MTTHLALAIINDSGDTLADSPFRLDFSEGRRQKVTESAEEMAELMNEMRTQLRMVMENLLENV